jgi:hypothetical protein
MMHTLPIPALLIPEEAARAARRLRMSATNTVGSSSGGHTLLMREECWLKRLTLLEAAALRDCCLMLLEAAAVRGC